MDRKSSAQTNAPQPDYERLLSLFYDATRVPVTLFRNGELLMSFHGIFSDHNLPLLLSAGLPRPLPAFWSASVGGHIRFGGIRLRDGLDLFAGPCPAHPLSQNHLTEILRETGGRPKDLADYRTFLEHNAELQESSLVSNLRLLQALFARPVHAGSPGGDGRPGCDAPSARDDAPGQDEIVDRSEPVLLRYHRSSLLPVTALQIEPTDPGNEVYERSLLSAIRRGRPDEISGQTLSLTFQGSDQTSLSPMERSYMLGALSLLSRAAVDGGLPYNYAMQLQELVLDELLSAPDRRTQDRRFFHAIVFFAEEVRRFREESAGDPLSAAVAKYVNTHLHEKVTPSVLAGALGYDLSYLCAAFRRRNGCTVSEYVNHAKIREAKLLLQDGVYSLTQVSEMLAYSSPAYFSRVFRQVSGVTPGAYRKDPKSAGNGTTP